MPGVDRAVIEKALIQLEELGLLFEGYQFCREAERFCLLGRGGYSSVYEMFDVSNPQEHYALKVIGFERHKVATEDFNRTIHLQRVLSEQSENILRILAVKELCIRLNEDAEVEIVQPSEGIYLQFVLMEKLQGILTKDRFQNVSITREELHREGEVLQFARQIGKVISLMHQNKVLHRDIKLENIFWDEKKQQYKLGDFGIAKYMESGSAETIVYTDGYGAPEVGYRADENYNETADIYSFGITLYLLLNHLCFPGADGYYVNLVQYSPDFQLPAAKNAPPEWNRIIRKMCSYYREERYQSIEEVLAALNQLEESYAEKESKREEELWDFVTETYHEEKSSVRAMEQEMEVPAWKKRRLIEQKMRLQATHYAKWSVIYTLQMVPLLALLLWGVQEDAVFCGNWQFWLLPIAVLIEAIFLRIKEFHISFGIVVGVFIIYSVMSVGLKAAHVLLVLCMITEMPMFCMAGSLGTGLWILLYQMENSILKYIHSLELSWIILSLLFIVLYKCVVMLEATERMGKKAAGICFWAWERLPIWLIVVGICIRLLVWLGFEEVFDVLRELHLTLTGMVLYLRSKKVSGEYIIYYDEEGNLIDDVSMDA